MQLRFTQKHGEELQTGDLSAGQFLNVAIEAGKVLGWIFSNINETGFIACTNNGLFSWNAEVRLKVKEGSANLLSQSRNNEIIEFGKDKENLQTFISVFDELRNELMPENFTLQYKSLQEDAA
jgi:rhomboid protease GluP